MLWSSFAGAVQSAAAGVVVLQGAVGGVCVFCIFAAVAKHASAAHEYHLPL